MSFDEDQSGGNGTVAEVEDEDEDDGAGDVAGNDVGFAGDNAGGDGGKQRADSGAAVDISVDVRGGLGRPRLTHKDSMVFHRETVRKSKSDSGLNFSSPSSRKASEEEGGREENMESGNFGVVEVTEDDGEESWTGDLCPEKAREGVRMLACFKASFGAGSGSSFALGGALEEAEDEE